MENILKDKRFSHISKDPKFRRIPKNERKIKIDKRFQSMFKDKNFYIKYTVDKRGRPINLTSTENLRKYYAISSSEKDSSSEESEFSVQKNVLNKQKFCNTEKLQQDDIKNKNNRTKKSEKVSKETELIQNVKQLKTKKKTEKKIDNYVKKKLQNLNIDYARGEEILLSNSSSCEESSEYDNEEEVDHNWGELDKEIETTNEVTNRLAVCNMDWDRIRAIDLMVLFNSFLPTGGLIDSVTIYPSEFGLQRMKDEELKGPIELVEINNKNLCKKNDKYTDSENEEGLNFNMEKLREYQLNRLKYYYAVVVFDSDNTAHKIYNECDGLEYESSSTKLDLRFIPDYITFSHEPKEFCNELPNLVNYKPRQFTTTALQQVKVNLTWDETNPERQEISQKLHCGKFEDIDENDIQAYLASGSSEDESEDKIKKHLEGINSLNIDSNSLDKYKLLLKSIEQTEEKEKKEEVELEFTWGLDVKEKAKKFVEEKMKKNENLTSFQKYLEKRKTKKIIKREHKRKNLFKDYTNESNSEDSIPFNEEINNTYCSEEMKNIKSKVKKRKNSSINDDRLTIFTDEQRKKSDKAELELLLMDENKEANKYHFNMKRIEQSETLTKSKRKYLTKKKKRLNEEVSKNNFEVDVKDLRFSALFTSHHYNIDPADSHYRKTKGTEAFVREKLNRRIKSDNIAINQESTSEENNCKHFKVNAELDSLIKSINKNTKNLKKQKNCVI